MRIGFDGKRIIQNFTGLGNYSRYILNLLACNFPEHTYHVYSPTKPEQQITSASSVIFRHPRHSYLKSFWRSFGMVSDLKKDKIDLFHGLSNEIPFGLRRAKIPAVVTIHDLIFLRYPQYYNVLDRKIYELKVKYVCTHADRIIAVSKQTQRDLMTFFNIPEERIEVVYQNCNSIFQKKASDSEKGQVRHKYNLPENFLLNVGTIEPRKNLLLVAKALKSVPEEVHLVVVGKQTDYARLVKQYLKQHNLGHRVHFLKDVPIAELPAIYQLASVFIYPSEFEGFGIPVLEALHSGVPVIAATGSCLEEAGGPSSFYVHPRDEIQLGYCINYILNHPLKSKEMAEAGFNHAENFLDAKIARDLMGVYMKTIDNA